jgi:isoleucyl-tRNA synthetase
VLVSTHPKEGLAVAADKLLTVAVDAALTPELKAEGLAREIVRRIQSMRKDAGFNIEDRIHTYYLASGVIAGAVVNWSDTLRAETLSTKLEAGEPPQGAYVEQHTIEGQPITLGVLRSE